MLYNRHAQLPFGAGRGVAPVGRGDGLAADEEQPRVVAAGRRAGRRR
ncbi:hypothetical protein LT493_15565 [Streptomyces tricolor]|nr:hypothetical protein [Streptomyces tricolor]